MKSGKSIPIIRTAYPYLTDREKEYLKEHEKELKEKNISPDEDVKRIFAKIGVDIDLDSYMQVFK